MGASGSMHRWEFQDPKMEVRQYHIRSYKTVFCGDIMIYLLVGGLEHGFYVHFIYGMSSFPLTYSYFSEGFKPPTSYGRTNR